MRDLTRRYRLTGTVAPKPHGGGAVAKLGSAQLPIVQALVEAQPDALLVELCEGTTNLSKIDQRGEEQRKIKSATW